MNVLQDELMRWFGRLWHGKPLALTVVCISIMVSLAFYLVARKTIPAPPET